MNISLYGNHTLPYGYDCCSYIWLRELIDVRKRVTNEIVEYIYKVFFMCTSTTSFILRTIILGTCMNLKKTRKKPVFWVTCKKPVFFDFLSKPEINP